MVTCRDIDYYCLLSREKSVRLTDWQDMTNHVENGIETNIHSNTVCPLIHFKLCVLMKFFLETYYNKIKEFRNLCGFNKIYARIRTCIRKDMIMLERLCLSIISPVVNLLCYVSILFLPQMNNRIIWER